MRRTFMSLAVIASVGLARTAIAAGPPCDTLGATEDPNNIPQVYIENGDTQEPLVKALGALLVKSATPLRIIYRNRPTCSIRKSLFTGATMVVATDAGAGGTTTPRPVKYIKADGSGSAECSVPDPGGAGKPIVLGIGATYLSSCEPSDILQPATVGVFEGPVQSYGFIVPKAPLSSQVAITAEQGYLAYGFPNATGDAAPWIVQDLRFKRGPTASTALTLASALGIRPVTKLQGHADSGKSEDILAAIMNETTNPEAAIGTIGTELYDQHRGDVKLLAFRTFNQKYAYYPDSGSDVFDKANVRDGHYVPWAPTPYISPLAGTAIADANARRIYELVLGTRAADDVDGLLTVTRSGLVPRCAMKVNRSADGADLALYSDPAPCGCYFEKNAGPAGGATTCKACPGGDGDCGGGKCRLGFCEAR